MLSRGGIHRSAVLKKIPYIRLCSNNACSAKRNDGVNERELKSFSEIPGPKPLPVLGTLYKYLPFIGEYSFSHLHETGAKKLKRFGPLVREEIVAGEPVVWVFRPEDIAQVFKAETGLNPQRKSHLALLKYRKDRPNVYNSGGLLPTNGCEWWRIRREFQKVLSKPQNVTHYLGETDVVVKEFVNMCSEERFPDFLSPLSRLFLELTCLVTFDVRMHSLSKEERHKNSRSSKLINAAFATNSAILKLDNGPRLWRFFETRLYKRMQRAQAYMEEVALDMVSQKMQNRERNSRSLLSAYLENAALDVKDVVGMACDMLLAGVDTTTYSTAFTLYHLARNVEAQAKLRAEATELLENIDQPITVELLRKASYTKAVIKEAFRLNPISVGIGRILQTDVVLSGYFVPKGTTVVTQNQVICRLPEYFKDPDCFIPERWLRESINNEEKFDKKPVHPYLLLPFGHGPRSCIARRFAEQNMQVFLLRMCRQLKFLWQGGELKPVSLLINKPNGPIMLEFEKF